MSQKTIQIGIIGMGGFARNHHRIIQALEMEGECRLVCACEPVPEIYQKTAEEFALVSRGVELYENYVEMLDAHVGQLDMVCVPTPIELHASMHEACVKRGIACYLEKPPTLFYEELEGMIAVDAEAKKKTQVGFNNISEPERQALKKRIVSGEFGAVKRVSLSSLGPRGKVYYNRNHWAGHLMKQSSRGLYPILDSIVGNAQAHFVQNVLFWADGGDLMGYPEIQSVEAQLYRAKTIQGPDTIFARIHCTNGIEIRIGASHACLSSKTIKQEVVQCEKATIRYDANNVASIETEGGIEEIPLSPPQYPEPRNFTHYFKYLRREEDRPTVTLKESQPFVELNGLIYIAGKQIHPIPDDVKEFPGEGEELRAGEEAAIQGIIPVIDTFTAKGLFPDQQALSWAKQGGAASREDLPKLLSVIEAMAEASGIEV